MKDKEYEKKKESYKQIHELEESIEIHRQSSRKSIGSSEKSRAIVDDNNLEQLIDYKQIGIEV